MRRRLIFPQGHATPRGAYSPAVRIELPGAAMLFATGQLARAPDGSVVGPGDVALQTEYIYTLIGEILKEAAMGFADIVRVQTYLVRMDDAPIYSEVRDRYLGACRPASTLIEVKGLALEGCCVEVEVTAIRTGH
jgi:enamine deaminase RidA (YjgF/YER057c/UK114 family)